LNGTQNVTYIPYFGDITSGFKNTQTKGSPMHFTVVLRESNKHKIIVVRIIAVNFCIIPL